MKILQTIAASVSFAIVAVLFDSMPTVGICLGFAVGVFVYLAVDKSLASNQAERQKAREDEDKRFDNGEMTPDERASYVKKKLSFIEMAYQHGDLTLLELEALKKKYTGESFYLDNLGMEITAATSNKVQVERAIAQQRKDAERNLIINAAVGNAVGGTAGTIIGAATSAQSAAQEAADLEKLRVAAEQNYRQAIERSTKR